jgi:pyruvate-formate lyase-activating enzyme/TusA-related sulfurtransferase
MALRANIELEAGAKTFATGLLLDLIAALRSMRPGDLIAVVSSDRMLGAGLEAWCRFTRNSLVDVGNEQDRHRWVIRCGEAPAETDRETSAESPRALGSRLWLYTNFDCNLRCDYCCVRSSPKALRRALGSERVQRIAREATALSVGEIFVTGGEPFLLADIGDILTACAAAAPTTVLTNGMLLVGRRLQILRALPRDRVTFQISLDSPTPERHDRHRGAGTWAKAWKGIERARAEGFRVRLAATVATEAEAAEFRQFLDSKEVSEQNRVVRRIALRGFAEDGIALARADLVPEITITADGVYWHPVGAEDQDFLVTRNIFPLADAFAAARRAWERERAHTRRLAAIFNCA